MTRRLNGSSVETKLLRLSPFLFLPILYFSFFGFVSVVKAQKIVPSEWKIMPLGDSLTEGGGHSTSYRGFLRRMLIEKGYKVDFVGRRKSQAFGDLNPPDLDHSGHGGYTIGPDESRFGSSDKKANIFDNLNRILNYNPDVILLLIGVNDLFPNPNRPVSPAEADSKLIRLVQEISKILPQAQILVSSLLQVKWDEKGWAPYSAVNRAAKEIGEASASDRIHFVDLHSINLVDADFSDDLHLSKRGAKKIAKGWFKALEPILSTSSPCR